MQQNISQRDRPARNTRRYYGQAIANQQSKMVDQEKNKKDTIKESLLEQTEYQISENNASKIKMNN